LSKYIWAVLSFRGVSSAEGFTKRYELHYQLRKIEIDGAELLLQYDCLNFQAKRGGLGLGHKPGSTVKFL
jgi:hypothetical protein